MVRVGLIAAPTRHENPGTKPLIISHTHKFIFVKTRKTAGSSIEVELSKYCGPDDVVTPISPPVSGHVPRNDKGFFNPIAEILERTAQGRKATFVDLLSQRRYYNHMKAALIRSRVGRRCWNEYLTFSIDRNPWDKTVSHYAMLRERSHGKLSPDDYFSNGVFATNFEHYADHDGNIIVDRIIRYENLDDELAEILGSLGLTFGGKLVANAKSGHRLSTDNWENLFGSKYDTKMVEIFRREIEIFGYEHP